MGEKEVKFSPEFVIKSLLAGGVAGMCAMTTVAPLDRIKILLQAQNIHYRNMGVLAGFRKIVINENVRALATIVQHKSGTVKSIFLCHEVYEMAPCLRNDP